MAEVILKYEDVVLRGRDGQMYSAQACGRSREDATWEGWIEFVTEGAGAVQTGRETTQPSREHLTYWATGLTAGYLDGALLRALTPPPEIRDSTVNAEPAFDQPAPHPDVEVLTGPVPVLDPFKVYAEGDEILRGQLQALSGAQLRNIAKAYQLTDMSNAQLERLTDAELVALIRVKVENQMPG